MLLGMFNSSLVVTACLGPLNLLSAAIYACFRMYILWSFWWPSTMRWHTMSLSQVHSFHFVLLPSWLPFFCFLFIAIGFPLYFPLLIGSSCLAPKHKLAILVDTEWLVAFWNFECWSFFISDFCRFGFFCVRASRTFWIDGFWDLLMLPDGFWKAAILEIWPFRVSKVL